MNIVPRETFEPVSWLLVFNHEASTRWRSFLALGRFKHVWACAYVPTCNSWLVYDVHLDGTTMGLVPDGEPFLAFFGRQTQGMRKATLLRMPVNRSGNCHGNRHAKFNRGGYFMHRLGFWCVPAIKHLIGVRCCSMRPDAFFRSCLRNGGVLFEGAVSASSNEFLAAEGDQNTVRV